MIRRFFDVEYANTYKVGSDDTGLDRLNLCLLQNNFIHVIVLFLYCHNEAFVVQNMIPDYTLLNGVIWISLGCSLHVSYGTSSIRLALREC